MKILILGRSLNSGGAERQFILLANKLSELGHEVKFAVFYNNGTLENQLYPSVSLYHLSKTSRYDVISPLIQWLKLTKKFNPDIIYSFLPAPNIFAAIGRLLTIKPKYQLIWGVRTSKMNLKFYDFFTRFIYHLEPLLSFIPNKVIFNSKSGYMSYSNLLAKSKGHVVQNGIDTAYFFYSPTERIAFREKLKVSDKEILLGYVGRVDPVKNLELLLEAFCKLPRKNTRLLIVGLQNNDYNLRFSQLVASQERSNDIILLPFTNELREVYSAIDIFILPSLSEGCSNSLIEAITCSCQVIASDVGDNADLCKEDNVFDLTIDSLIKMILNQMDHQLNRNTIHMYSNSKLVKKTLEIFNA